MFGGGARSRVSISGAATDKDVRNWLRRAVGSVGQVAALVRPVWVSRTPAAWRGHRWCRAVVGVVLDSITAATSDPKAAAGRQRVRTPATMSAECRHSGSSRAMYPTARAYLVAPARDPAPLDSASVGASRLPPPSPDRSTTTDLSAAEGGPIDRESLRRPPSPNARSASAEPPAGSRREGGPQVASSHSRCRSRWLAPRQPDDRITRIGRARALSLQNRRSF